jgi:hypothetical protein
MTFNPIEIYQRPEKNTICKLIRLDPIRPWPDPISSIKSNWPDRPDPNLNPTRPAWLPPLMRRKERRWLGLKDFAKGTFFICFSLNELWRVKDRKKKLAKQSHIMVEPAYVRKKNDVAVIWLSLAEQRMDENKLTFNDKKTQTQKSTLSSYTRLWSSITH